MKKVIEAINVSKKFRIYPSPFDRMMDLIGIGSVKAKEFNALNKIDFSVAEGEFYGILGRNGSGKSTLLKIIAGHTSQTEGSLIRSGRISLLQLGLGFDPELTGIQNIIKSRELQNLNNENENLITEIINFSEIGDFINYPVKTYSSGMYSRLAFSAAIMGDYDVLIADEVLAVGDLSFSQKCLKKMRELKDNGKTLILVTHDIDAVKGFCDKAMWLDGGNIISNGLAKKVAEDFRNYMLYGVFPSNRKENEIASAQHDVAGVKSNDQWLIPKKEKLAIKKSSINIEKYRLIDQSSIMMNTVKGGQNLKFQMQYSCQESDVNLTSIGITIHDGKGRIAAHINSSFFSDEKLIQSEKLALAEFDFEFPPLNAGEYSISFSIDGIKEVEDELLIKYDYDSHLKVEKTQEKTVRLQAGYVIVNKCSFKVSEYE